MSDAARFYPINEDHALQSVKFGIKFNAALSQQQLNGITIHHQKNWSSELPAVFAPTFEFEITPQGPVRRPAVSPGIAFSFLRPDATPAWTVKIEGQDITVECSRYTGWDRVWATAKRYLDGCLSAVEVSDAQHTVRVWMMTLDVVDKFRAERESYDLSALFQKNDYISQKMFSAGALWHTHAGWFQILRNQNCLQRLNFDARREDYVEPKDNESTKAIFVTMTHLQQLRYDPHIEVGSFREAQLDQDMTEMHKLNKSTVCEVLTDDIRKRIGLED